jgi:hypothetical protein
VSPYRTFSPGSRFHGLHSRWVSRCAKILLTLASICACLKLKVGLVVQQPRIGEPVSVLDSPVSTSLLVFSRATILEGGTSGTLEYV